MRGITVIKPETPPREEDIERLREGVAQILKGIKEKGDEALREFSKRFDNYDPPSFRVSEEEMDEAERSIAPEVRRGLDYGIERVKAFAQAQRARLQEFEEEMAPGIFMGHRVVPVDSCACYVPAGRYPCLTSAVMSIVPAKVAGVRRLLTCSPPGRDGHINWPILYTMRASGADEVYCMGGAHAIGAVAYGTEAIPRVDLVVGPGNRWVTEAKRQVYGEVGIDFLAGPSEVLVIADSTGRPDWIAADLLAQLEHDPNARGCLVTTSEKLARTTIKEVERQLERLSTGDVAGVSWKNNGLVAVADDLDAACAFTNDYAPEHLEVHTENPKALLPKLTSYGSLFLGEMAAEVFADKVAGTNHILPTLRAARYTGGVWVGTFLKVITHQWVSRQGMEVLAPISARQALEEGMAAHRAAAQIRMGERAS